MTISQKIKKTNSLLEESMIDTILLINTKNIRERNIDYFISQSICDFTCLLLISPDRIKLITSLLEDLKEKNIEIIKVKNPLSKENVREYIKNAKNIGIVEENFPISVKKFIRGKKLVDISGKLAKIREIKDDDEIKKIKFSCKIAEECIYEIKENISRRTKESDVVKIIKSVIARYSDASLAFSPIIASGNRSGMIHPIPQYSSKKIKDFCIIDFGIRYKGYCCDITAPFILGDLDIKKRKLIEIVEKAYVKTFEIIRHTRKANEIFMIINEFIKNCGYELKHSLGHGIGLDVHELPQISPNSIDDLRDGMVFTIEPGIYTSSFGCRIENIFYIKNGVKNISNFKIVEKI